jgi:hypothetical protein
MVSLVSSSLEPSLGNMSVLLSALLSVFMDHLEFPLKGSYVFTYVYVCVNLHLCELFALVTFHDYKMLYNK